MTGASRSSVKWTVTVVTWPARSLAVTIRVCGPSAVTGVPLAKTAPSRVATTDLSRSSVAVKAGVTEAARLTWPSATPETVTTGGCVAREGARVAVRERRGLAAVGGPRLEVVARAHRQADGGAGIAPAEPSGELPLAVVDDALEQRRRRRGRHRCRPLLPRALFRRRLR